MRVRLSDLAEQDLVDIVTYIAEDSPSQALAYAERLEQACAELAEHALRFESIPRYEGLGYRRRPYGRHLIIYSVSHDEVFVVRIVSAAMDIDRALRPD